MEGYLGGKATSTVRCLILVPLMSWFSLHCEEGFDLPSGILADLHKSPGLIRLDVGWTEVARCYQQIPSAKSGVIRLGPQHQGITETFPWWNQLTITSSLEISWDCQEFLVFHGCVSGAPYPSHWQKPWGVGELQAGQTDVQPFLGQSRLLKICHLHSFAPAFSGIWNDLEYEQCVSNHFEAKTLKKWCYTVLNFGKSRYNLALICFARHVKAKVQDKLVNCQDPQVSTTYGNALQSIMRFCFWMLGC